MSTVLTNNTFRTRKDLVSYIQRIIAELELGLQDSDVDFEIVVLITTLELALACMERSERHRLA